jgi:photosystem II stability/assembly factor-like uncharacterized protein
LFRWSPDRPNGWEHLVSGSLLLSAIVRESTDGRLLMAGTEDDGILVSRDGGRTWDGANPGLLDLTILALALSPDFEDDGIGFAATPSGLYRTRNGAESWRAARLEWDDAAIQCLAISPSFGEDRVVLAGTEEYGLLRSDDAGRSWSVVPDLAERSINALIWTEGSNVLAATDAGLARSSDGGQQWESIGADLGPTLCAAWVPAPSPELPILLAGRPDQGLARSTDGGQTWAPANGGLHASLVVGLALSPAFAHDQTMFAASLQSGVSVSRNGGRTWTESSVGLPDPTVLQLAISPAFAEDRTLLAATGGGLYVSRDGGAGWQPALPDEPGVPASTVVTGPAHLAALADGRLMLAGDGGASWRSLDGSFEGGEVLALAVSPSFAQDRTMFVATAGPAHEDGLRDLVAWASTDGGTTWERWLEERGAPPMQLLVLPTSERVVVGLGGRVLRPLRSAREVRRGVRRPLWSSTDLPGGAVIAGLTASPTYAQDRTLFAATSLGVYVSRDGGDRFTAWSEDLDPPAMVEVTVSPAFAEDRQVYALGLGGTIWHREDR